MDFRRGRCDCRRPHKLADDVGHACKSERDVNTIIAKVDEVRRARAHASTFDIFLDIIHENPKLAKAAGAGLVRLYDALAATVPTPVSPSGAVPGSSAGSHAKP